MKNFNLNLKNLIKYIKQKKIYFGAALIAVALLTSAFFAGGSLSDVPVNKISTPDLISSNYDDISVSSESSDIALASDDHKQEVQSTTFESSSEPSTADDKNAENAQKNNSDITANSQNNFEDNAESSSALSPYSKNYYYPGNSGNESDNNKPTSSNNVKDKYNTEAVPDGKPKPVEPQDQEIEDNELTCTISINCSTILDNLDKFNPDKLELVPEDGWILKSTKVKFNEGECVYDILARVCKENKIHMSAKWTPGYNTYYIESINNIKEFDCPIDRFHNTSGWMYSVNDWYPNYGFSRYELKNGDVVEFKYTCVGLGADLGAENSTGG